MDRDELRAVQASLRERYRDEPGAARITSSANGTLGEGVSCSVQPGRALAQAGLHPASGGDSTLLCSGDMLLEALVASAGVTLRAVATSLGISVTAVQVRAEAIWTFVGRSALTARLRLASLRFASPSHWRATPTTSSWRRWNG